MKETFSLNCIKCKNKYLSEDPDPYFCEKCLQTKNQIAQEIDKKFANRPKKEIKSDLKIYNEITARGVRFPNIKDLGITL